MGNGIASSSRQSGTHRNDIFLKSYQKTEASYFTRLRSCSTNHMGTLTSPLSFIKSL